MKKVYEEIASRCLARRNCRETGNTLWEEKHTAILREIEKTCLPSGSGFDSGTTIDFEKSSDKKIVLYTSYHHMVDGYYAGWTDHTVYIRPSLAFGFTISHISGPNRDDIYGYIAEGIDAALHSVYGKDE